MSTSSVTPMRLVPLNDLSTTTSQPSIMNQPAGVTHSSLDLPIITSSQISINKQNNVSNFSNLDKELMEIIHNNDLNDDAKAKLYWTSLHRAEILKDRSMWTEPVVVELKENRFIPVPIMKTEKVDNLSQAVGNKRKIIFKAQTPKFSNASITPVINPQINDIESSKEKNLNTEVEDSNDTLKRMALVNRIQNGVISPSNFARNVSISKPLIVYNQQDQEQNVESQPPISPNQNILLNSPAQPVLRPIWFQLFLKKIEKEPDNIKVRITNLIEKIIVKDSGFKITHNSFLSNNKELFQTDPKNFLLQIVRGIQKSTNRTKIFANYLEKLGVTVDQAGAGFRRKIIKRWVHL
jgi:hypothetical protein